MKHAILRENEAKRLKVPFGLLLCFAMFCFWQMGFIYFMGPALSINGRTPLPISMDNVTAIIAISYVLCILWMIFPAAVCYSGRPGQHPRGTVYGAWTVSAPVGRNFANAYLHTCFQLLLYDWL